MNATLTARPLAYLDPSRRKAVHSGKRVLGGERGDLFELFPLKYPWAWELYKTMMTNHWEPEEIKMQDDIDQWRSDDLTESERWIVRMGIGYFSAAEGIVGDNLLHVIRDKVTAPELRLVLGRHAHEENIHADSLLYMISSLGIDPHQCEAMFEQIPSIRKKNEFVNRVSRTLRRDMDMSVRENQRLFAKNAFLFGQCLEGTQFFGLFAMILGLKENCGKFPGIAEMFKYTLRDESNHIDLLRHLFLEIVKENPTILDEAFKEELCGLMREAVALEKEFIYDCMPSNMVGMSADLLATYIDYIADRRLDGVNLPTSGRNLKSPLPWLDRVIFAVREDNFFERQVTSYQQSDAVERTLPWLEPGILFDEASETKGQPEEQCPSAELTFVGNSLGDLQARVAS